ncbi:MAG TPA: TIGR02996 domain-containing protein [Kofleriaceae bacterium]|jgi:uncharacterized protein (TIGR02996 family)
MREDLLAAICAAPFDDAPRQVYADALIEAGEPLGEWIAMDLAKARGPLDANAQARFDELARMLDLATRSHGVSRYGFVELARGFPHALHAGGNVRSVVDVPAFATVERLLDLRGCSDATVLAVLDHPSAANLREVSTIRTSIVERACTTRRAWTALDLYAKLLDPLPPRAIYAQMPDLERLRIQLEGPREAPLAIAGPRESRSGSDRRIDTLDLPESLDSLDLWFERGGIETLALPHLRELVFGLESWIALPRITVAAPIDTVDLMYVPQISVAQLAVFTGVRKLTLGIDRYDASTFAALTSLESLRLHAGAVALDAFARLANLRVLEVRGTIDRRMSLPPLRELSAWYPPSPDDVSALVRRLPRLEQLSLDAEHRDAADVEPSHVATWMPAIAASSIRRFALTYSDTGYELVLERGDDGRLAITKGRGDAIGDAIAAAL